MPKALITGITGQDGSYLAEFLLAKGYEVHGIVRRTSSFNTERIEHIYADPHEPDERLRLHYGDLNDASSLQRVLAHRGAGRGLQPRCAEPRARQLRRAGVHRGSRRHWERCGCSKRCANLGMSPRFYQASSSEMYGKVVETPQTETTPFHPRSRTRARRCSPITPR